MTEKLHHEVELVVALGKGGRNVEADGAPALVFGYAVGVDLTRRDLQEHSKEKGRPWTTAKGFDCSAPLSAIRQLPGDALPAAAEISLNVNGELRQRATLDEMIWSVPEIICELSRYFELKPGDLVFTGTPAGVGPVHPGDQVACQIEGVAELAFGMEGATYLPPR
jgi:fumarylpyruvate hydrolase